MSRTHPEPRSGARTGLLGEFLRARRAGAPVTEPTGRRRVSGLRREEVAVAAGVSIDYYTRLEQGRERNPSDAVLRALAAPLALGDDELAHLRALRDTGTGERPAAPDGELTARMQRLVEAVRPHPAYVLDRLSDVVAANPEGLALFAGLGDLPTARRNTCRYLVTSARARETFVDWADEARSSVAALRAATAGDPAVPGLSDLIAELSAAEPLFRTWWDSHAVLRRRASSKLIRDADGRARSWAYEVLALPHDGLRMTMYLADRER